MAIKVNQHLIRVYKNLVEKVMEEHNLKSVMIDEKLLSETLRIFNLKHGWEKISHKEFRKKDPAHGAISIFAYFDNSTIEPQVYFSWCWIDSGGKLVKDSSVFLTPDDCVDDIIKFFTDIQPKLSYAAWHGQGKTEYEACNDAWEKYGWY